MRFFALFVAALPLCGAQAQYEFPLLSAAGNPLLHPKEISANREIVLVYDEPAGTTFPTKHKLFDVNTFTSTTLNTNIQLNTAGPVFNGLQNHGTRKLGLVVGDLNGDGRSEYVVATAGADQTVRLKAYGAVPVVTPLTVLEGGSGQDAGPLFGAGAGLADASAGYMKLKCGDVDGDNDDEVVLLYRVVGSNALRLNVFNANATFSLTSVATIQDEVLNVFGTGTSAMEAFDLEVVDLDHDGNSEVVIAGNVVEGGFRKPFLKVYDVQVVGPTYTLVPRDRYVIPSTVSSSLPIALSITTGDLNNDNLLEVALVYGFSLSSSGSNVDTYIHLFRVGDDVVATPGPSDFLERIVPMPEVFSLQTGNDGLATLEMEAGDLDGNGSEELVLATRNSINVYRVNADFSFLSLNGVSVVPNISNLHYENYLSVGDMNNDGRAEIVNARNWLTPDVPQEYRMALTVHQLNAATNQLQQVVSSDGLLPLNPGNGARQFAMAIGDIDGDGVRLGQAALYQLTGVIQPIFVLNAPPTHSDDIGPGGWTDVNGIFNPLDCSDFTASCTQTTTTEFAVETTVSSSWSVSATVGAGYDGLVASVSASMTASYGEGFGNTSGSAQTYTESMTHDICYDDAVYASITNYNVYEFPVYANDTLACYILTIHPEPPVFAWLESKEIAARGYVPTHEVGNLLSYRRVGANEVPASDIFAQTNISVGQVSGNTWTISASNIQSSGTSTSRDVGFEASLEASAFGFSVGASGSYDLSTISTHNVTVGSDITISTAVGNIGANAPAMSYDLRPYLIWGNGGAFTLDYETDPAGPFYAAYDTQDPALNLPWRLETQRGLQLLDPAERWRSKSFFLSDRDPEPGDTISVTLRVYNYSNTPTLGSVDASFYLGHPLFGGVLQQSVQGETVFTNPEPVPAQGVRTFTFDWVVPTDNTVIGRLYARLDPGNDMTEVHEDNNIGFVSLGGYFPNQVEVGIADLGASRAQGLQCFPNPATGFCTLALELPATGRAQVNIRSAQGALVRTVDAGPLPRGASTLDLDLNGLAPGVYTVSLEVAGTQHTARLVVM
jgi:hypothetical protein